MASSRLHAPVDSGYIPPTDTPRHSDVQHPATPGTCTPYSGKSDLISQRTVPTCGILQLYPDIHHIIVAYLPPESIYAMILFLSSPIIRRESLPNLHVYAWAASKLGSCGKMLMQTLALPEFSLHAFRVLLDVCPKRELTNQRDDAHWGLRTRAEREAESIRCVANNTRWLAGFCGKKFSTLELARLYPRDAPETFSNPINMAAAVGECSHPLEPCHMQCLVSSNACSRGIPCRMCFAAIRCVCTLGLAGSQSARHNKNPLVQT
jgi:hypothetical protein